MEKSMDKCFDNVSQRDELGLLYTASQIIRTEMEDWNFTWSYTYETKTFHKMGD